MEKGSQSTFYIIETQFPSCIFFSVKNMIFGNIKDKSWKSMSKLIEIGLWRSGYFLAKYKIVSIQHGKFITKFIDAIYKELQAGFWKVNISLHQSIAPLPRVRGERCSRFFLSKTRISLKFGLTRPGRARVEYRCHRFPWFTSRGWP